MQSRFMTAVTLFAAVGFLAGCQQDKQQTATVPQTATVTSVETAAATPPVADVTTIATSTEFQTPSPTDTTEAVPSVLRRTPAAEPTPPPVQQVTATYPPRVTVSDLREMMDEGSAVVVDVRDRVSFATEHIPGSINIPFQETASRIGELPRGKTIVTYCA